MRNLSSVDRIEIKFKTKWHLKGFFLPTCVFGTFVFNRGLFPLFLQVLLLDLSSTTNSCTNSATPPRSCWTRPRGQKRAGLATKSPLRSKSTWSGGIQAARMTSWFNWLYVGWKLMKTDESQLECFFETVYRSNTTFLRSNRVNYCRIFKKLIAVYSWKSVEGFIL